MESALTHLMVTGARGRLGSLIAQFFFKNPHYRVIAVDRAYEEETIPTYGVSADLMDPESYEHLLKDVKILIHVAQHPQSFVTTDPEVFKINQRMTENMVNSCLAMGVPKFVLISSASTMIRSIDTDLISDQTSSSTHFYSGFARSKYLEELIVRRAEAEGLKVIILNTVPVRSKSEQKYWPDELEFSMDEEFFLTRLQQSLDSEIWGTQEILSPAPGGIRIKRKNKVKTGFLEKFYGFFSRLRNSDKNQQSEAAFWQEYSFTLESDKGS